VRRKVIQIDESKCNGCGACITSCAEGALQIVEGKARLMSDKYCDGLGACLSECPTGALTIVEREAEEFDEKAVHARMNNTPAPSMHIGAGHHACPGAAVRIGNRKRALKASSNDAGPLQAIPSELEQWPVQLHLVQPGMPFFKNRELVVLSTCSPVASADAHWRFIRGRSVVVACPKLDRLDGYVEKLAAILSEKTIPRVLVLRMEVPCCGGLTAIVEEAAARTGRSELEVREIIVGLNGDIEAMSAEG